MTTLVTGARGGLGRVLCAALRERRGGDVVGLVRQEPGADEVRADVTDALAVSEVLKRVRPKLVYHLAGSFAHQYDTDYAVNAASARHILEAVAAAGLGTRVVLLGSAAEYGVVEPGENPIAEDRVLRPVSLYGLTKAHQTQLAHFHAHALGADVVVARMFNLFAQGLSRRIFVGRVEALVEQYRRGEIATIEVGNLDSRRDYVDAEEAVRQLELIAARGRAGSVYHVASGEPVTMRAVLQRMLSAAAIPDGAVRENLPGAGGRVGYDVPVIYADMRRTRALAQALP